MAILKLNDFRQPSISLVILFIYKLSAIKLIVKCNKEQRFTVFQCLFDVCRPIVCNVDYKVNHDGLVLPSTGNKKLHL